MYLNSILVAFAEQVASKRTINGTGPRLIIDMPPRHGKSTTVSQYFTAWAIGRWPWMRFMLGSYEMTRAEYWGNKTKETLCDTREIFAPTKVKNGRNARNREWYTYHHGGMMCAGRGGAFTGAGCEILICDDILKNDEEANSKTIRDKAWDWYLSTASTRLESYGGVIIVATRWHEDDLTGRLLAEEKAGGDKWQHVTFPAFCTQRQDDLNRKQNEALWPERFNTESLEATKRRIGKTWFSALFQQRPQPDEGTIFKKIYFKYATEDADNLYLHQPNGDTRTWSKSACRWYQTIDTASKEKTQNDFTVFNTIALTPEGDMIIYNVYRARIDITDMFKILRQMPTDAFFPRIEVQYIEDKTSGSSLLQMARKENLRVLPIQPGGSKESRARDIKLLVERDKIKLSTPAAVGYENGKIYHLRNQTWLDDFEAELTSFPKAAHDDQVDTVAYGWIVSQNMPIFEDACLVVTGKRIGEKDDNDDDPDEDWFENDGKVVDETEKQAQNPLDGIQPKGKSNGGTSIHPWQ